MKKLIIVSMLAVTLTLSSVTTSVFAATCGKNGEGKEIKTSIDFNCKSGDAGINTITSFLLTIINFMAIGVGIAVVGGIVYGGIRYASANGNASQAQQGVTYIVNSIIGLVLFIFMYAIINFLVPGGLFT